MQPTASNERGFSNASATSVFIPRSNSSFSQENEVFPKNFRNEIFRMGNSTDYQGMFGPLKINLPNFFFFSGFHYRMKLAN